MLNNKIIYNIIKVTIRYTSVCTRYTFLLKTIFDFDSDQGSDIITTTS